jgi:chromosome transmission fidelity protein 4
MSIVETGKLERALDLAERLHLEKSLDVAMTIADRLNHRNLSDRIYAVKERRFAMEEEPMEDLGPEDYTPHDDFEETESTTVSPEWPNVRKRTERHEDDWEEPKEKKSKTANSKSLAKPSNPFAKKKMESPARPSMSPGKSTPLKPALSRLSTFSAQSREKTKSAKKIL